MPYYPKNRIKPDQYTSGGDFTINGQSYTGHYYTTFDGKFFTGKNPFDKNANQVLTRQTPVTDNPDSTPSVNSSLYTTEPNVGTLLSAYYPKPTEEDYKQGYFFRYFIKRRKGNGSITEISRQAFNQYQANISLPDYALYQTVDILWQLTGPLRTDRTSRKYAKAGIVDTNERIVEKTDKTFRGLKAYIGENYTKFSRPS